MFPLKNVARKGLRFLGQHWHNLTFVKGYLKTYQYIDGLVHDCGILRTLVME